MIISLILLYKFIHFIINISNNKEITISNKSPVKKLLEYLNFLKLKEYSNYKYFVKSYFYIEFLKYGLLWFIIISIILV